MKTTVDIPEKTLKDSMKYSGASTKRDAILAAMDDYNHRQRVLAFSERIRKNPLKLMDNDEIEAADLVESTRQLADYQARASE